MFKINDNTIISTQLFHQHFDVKAALDIVSIIATDDKVFGQQDLPVRQMLKHLCENDTKDVSFHVLGGDAILSCIDAEPVTLKHVKVKNEEELLSKIKSFTDVSLLYDEVLLYELSHTDICINDITDNSNSESNNVIKLQSGEKVEYTLFTPFANLDSDINTIKIENISVNTGFAVIVVKNINNNILDIIRLKNGECMFANFIGKSLVEILPRLSVSIDHCNYFVFDHDGETNVGNFNFVTNITSFLATQNVTQFCADSDGGFLAVANGKLLPFTCLLNPVDDLDFGLNDGEIFVKVVLIGRMLLALTNKGRTLSNIDNNFNNMKNIISIGVGSTSFYVITTESKLIFEQKGEKTFVNDVYTVYSLLDDAVSIKKRDGTIIFNFNASKESHGTGKQIMTNSGIELKLEPVESILVSNDKNVDVAFSRINDVDDFALCRKNLGKDYKSIIVYHQSNVKQYNIKKQYENEGK